MAEQLKPLAESINQEPGFLWKVWTESEKNHEAGGIYLFTDEKRPCLSGKTYCRLKNLGVGEVVAKVFDVNEPLSQINQAKTRLTEFNQGRLAPFSSLSEISQILKSQPNLSDNTKFERMRTGK